MTYHNHALAMQLSLAGKDHIFPTYVSRFRHYTYYCMRRLVRSNPYWPLVIEISKNSEHS